MSTSEAALTLVPRDFDSLRSVIIDRKTSMPKRLAQVAAYALSNPDDMAFGTAASIAAAADVQPSTLVRLAHHLGYEGFSDLQNVFRARLRDRTLSYEERLLSLETGSASSSDTELLSGFLNAASQSVARLASAIDGETFSRSVDVLAQAETIYLVAKRRSYPLTAHIAYAFGKLGIRHHIIASPNGIDAEMVQFATKKDAVIHLIKMMKSHEAEETLAELAEGAGFTSPRRAKERGDLDSEGQAPEIGVTYQLPTGETWSRKGKAGATKKEFAAHAKTTTWAAMKA